MVSMLQSEASAKDESFNLRQFFASHSFAGPTVSGPEFSSLTRGPHLREFLKGIIGEAAIEAIVRSLRNTSEAFVKECATKDHPVTYLFEGEFDVDKSRSDKTLRASMGGRAALMVLRASNSLSGIVGGRGFIGVMGETIRDTEVSFRAAEPGRVTVKFRIKGTDAAGHADFIVGCIAYMAKTASFSSSAGSLNADSVSASATLLMLMTAGVGMKFTSPQVMADRVDSAVKAWEIRELPKDALLADWALTMSHATDNDWIEKTLTRLGIPPREDFVSALVSLGNVIAVLGPFETWRLKISDRKTLKVSFQRDVDVRNHMKYSPNLAKVHARAIKLFGVLPSPTHRDLPKTLKCVRVSPIVLTQNSRDPSPEPLDCVDVASDSDAPPVLSGQNSSTHSEVEEEQANLDDEDFARALDLTSVLETAFDMLSEKPKVETDTRASSSEPDFKKLWEEYMAHQKTPPLEVVAVAKPVAEKIWGPVNLNHDSERVPLAKANDDDRCSAGSSLLSVQADYRVKKVLATFASCSRCVVENSEQLYALMKARPEAVRSVLKHHYRLDLSQVNMVDQNLIGVATRDVVTEFTAQGAGALYLEDLAIIDVKQSMVSTVGAMNTNGLLQVYGSLVDPIPLLDLVAIKKHVAQLDLRGAKVYLNPPSTMFFGIHALRVADEIASTGLAAQIIVVLSVIATPSTEDVGGVFNAMKYPAIAEWPGKYDIFSVLQKDVSLMVLTLVGDNEDPREVLCKLLEVVPGNTDKIIAVKIFGRQAEIIIGTAALYTQLAMREEAEVEDSNFEQLIDKVAYDFADLLWWS